MTNQSNEDLEKTRLIILHKLQTRKTYDPSHYPTEEHLYADLIANHIHENFTLKQSDLDIRLNELKHRADDIIGRMYRLDRKYADSYIMGLVASTSQSATKTKGEN